MEFQGTILVVDDSPTQQKLVSNALVRNGYRVIVASDGDEALATALRERPAIVVLDVVMPKLNGYQVCRQLKSTAETRDIKVLLLSSKSTESDRFWGLKQGADAYLAKPFEDDALIANIRKIS
jgi:twitching motility two-component system response regulator PilH